MRCFCMSVFLAAGLAPQAVFAASVQEILAPRTGKVIHVRPDGNNKNAGTKEAPLKNVDKAIAKAAAGDTIAVAAGTYAGTFDVGLWEIDKDLKFYGGFNSDFTARDHVQNVTLLQPTEKRFENSGVKPMIYTKDNVTVKELVFDGFVVDQGQMTPYLNVGKPDGVDTGMMKTGPGARNPEATCLRIRGVNIAVRNNVFVNCANSAISIFVADKSSAVVENNVIVGSRMTGITAWGQKGKPGKIDIRGNTVAFTWTRTKDFADQGYGVDVQKDLTFNIENNIFALNLGPGINSQRFNNDVTLKSNVFWGNKKKDFWFNPKSNTSIQLNADQFGDLDIKTEGNQGKPLKIPFNGPYTDGVINAQYTEKVDYDPNSHANFMRELYGLRKRGTIESKVTMFANRYPWKEALALVGATPGVGAQKMK